MPSVRGSECGARGAGDGAGGAERLAATLDDDHGGEIPTAARSAPSERPGAGPADERSSGEAQPEKTSNPMKRKESPGARCLCICFSRFYTVQWMPPHRRIVGVSEKSSECAPGKDIESPLENFVTQERPADEMSASLVPPQAAETSSPAGFWARRRAFLAL